MYLTIIMLPLLASLVSGFFGRKIGTTGAQIITCGSLIIITFLSLLAFIEVGLNNIPVNLKLFSWIDSESINVIWNFNFDSLTVSMLIPVLVVSSLVHVYSIGYMSHDPHNQRFFSYLSLFTFMMIILVTANNYLVMFVGWEGVGVCSYLLVNFWYTRIAANQSALSAFLTNRVGDTLLTIGMFAIILTFGNLDYTTVFSLAPYVSENAIIFIGICLLIGAMAKSSQIGLHVWLPMAMEGPTPVSALIHAATMVTAGVYLLMRSSPLIEYSNTVLLICLWIGAVTTVFSSLIGLFQQDIKKVIAYSTMSQLGMMVISVGLSSYNLALFHLMNHAFYKALLFLGAGAVIHAVSDNQDFRKYGGLRVFLPLTYSVMLIASLSLVAFPFMTGYYSKDFIIESAYGQYSFSGTSVYVISTIAAMFTTLYSVKVLYLTFITNPNGPLVDYKNAHEGNLFMSIPLIILAVFSIFFGYVFKDAFIGLGSSFFIDNSIYIHSSHEIVMDTEFAVPTIYKLIPLILTLSLTILFILLSEFTYTLVKFKISKFGHSVYGFFNQRFYIELFYNTFITNYILKLGGQTTKIIDKGSIEFIGPYGLEKSLTWSSRSISKLDTGAVTSYALYILVGLVFYILMPYLYNIDNNILLILILGLFVPISHTSLEWIISNSPKFTLLSNKPIKSKGLFIHFIENVYIKVYLYFCNGGSKKLLYCYFTYVTIIAIVILINRCLPNLPLQDIFCILISIFDLNIYNSDMDYLYIGDAPHNSSTSDLPFTKFLSDLSNTLKANNISNSTKSDIASSTPTAAADTTTTTTSVSSGSNAAANSASTAAVAAGPVLNRPATYGDYKDCSDSSCTSDEDSANSDSDTQSWYPRKLRRIIPICENQAEIQMYKNTAREDLKDSLEEMEDLKKYRQQGINDGAEGFSRRFNGLALNLHDIREREIILKHNGSQLDPDVKEKCDEANKLAKFKHTCSKYGKQDGCKTTSYIHGTRSLMFYKDSNP